MLSDLEASPGRSPQEGAPYGNNGFLGRTSHNIT